MNIEWLSPVSQEFAAPPAVIDFAEIRNPLGHSPLLEARAKEKIGTTEEDLIHELAGLWKIPAESIVLGKGSTGIIKQIPRLFLRPSDTSIVPVPTYFGLLEEIPPAQTVEMQLPVKEGFSHAPEFHRSLLAEIDARRPGLVWLCSPNNPTGIVIPLDHIEAIALHAAPGIVVVDEAYQEIVDPGNAASAMHLIRRLPNIIVTRTFSKAYGLPEIQVGMAVADPGVASLLRNDHVVRPAENSLVLAAAALTDQEHILRTHELISQETAFVWDRVRALKHIEMGARTQSGVCIFRHCANSLREGLLQLGIKTNDFNNQSGIRNLGFVRLGLLDHAHNVTLVDALHELDKP